MDRIHGSLGHRRHHKHIVLMPGIGPFKAENLSVVQGIRTKALKSQIPKFLDSIQFYFLDICFVGEIGVDGFVVVSNENGNTTLFSCDT